MYVCVVVGRWGVGGWGGVGVGVEREKEGRKKE